MEKADDGREFRGTRDYGGTTIRIEKPVLKLSILASHPDINSDPVQVRIYLVKDFFKRKRRLADLMPNQNVWKTFEYNIPEEVGREVILLFKVSRTWNPQKTRGAPDPRNLGVALGQIEFEDKLSG